MGASSYQSSKSEIEVLERKKRQTPKGKTPEEEMEEVVESLVAEGYSRDEAKAFVAKSYKEKEQVITPEILDEIGLAPEEIGSPIKAGILTGLAFAISAVVPIVPFIIENKYTALGISIVCTLVALFGVGVIKTIFSRKNWIRSGLEMTAIGASAAAITFLIGRLTDILLPGSL
jgi:predicted membrane protein (TIGR00267 family)